MVAGSNRALAIEVVLRCRTGPAGAERIASGARMCRAAAVEIGMPSEAAPGEDSTERMRVRAAAAVARA